MTGSRLRSRQSAARGGAASILLAACSLLAPAARAAAAPQETPGAAAPSSLRVGSKAFTEGVILGEIATQALRAAGFETAHRRELGGTRLLWEALLAGEVDVYPEYTGTIREEIFGGPRSAGERAGAGEAGLRRALTMRGVGMSGPLGFDNTYAIGVPEATAGRLGLGAVSDLARHPELRLGFSHEFLDRPDGWPGVAAVYGLPHRHVRGLAHDLAYRALAAGEVDATDLYSTDAEIRHYRLRVLADDRGFFPEYQAVWLYREDLPAAAVAALRRLEGSIDEATMIAMNHRVKLGHEPEARVAADHLARAGIRAPVAGGETAAARLLRHTGEHLALVGVSLLAAIAIAIPLGILAARRPALGRPVLGAAGVLQTIPSLALLVFMIPLLGIGAAPAVAALFLYSLLPIVRNTATGLADVPQALRESALALGLPAGARLRWIELPMASRAILAGIKTAAVINVGTATLGALVGAGGFGQPILTGIRLDDVGLILQGAVPAALLALAVEAAFGHVERLAVPRGLRLGPGD